MNIEATLNQMLAQETSAGMAIKFGEDDLLRDTQTTSVTVKESSTSINRVKNIEMDDTQLSGTAYLVYKTTRKENKYFDVRTDKCNEIEAPVCKITESTSPNVEVCRPVCKTTEAPTCMTVDIVDKYFNNEENPRLKINIIRTAKDSEVFPHAGRRRRQLARYITSATDEAIKAGSRKEKFDRCQYIFSKKKMHFHYRQHLTKHLCNSGYSSLGTTLYINTCTTDITQNRPTLSTRQIV